MSAPDSLVADCRALAAAGAWSDLDALLRIHALEARTSPTLITLVTETLLRTGRPGEALAWMREHESTVVLSGDRSSVRRAANLCGAAHVELGELNAAAEAFQRALDLASGDGDDLLVARATNNLAVLANIRGRHEEALGLYAAALPAYQRLGNPNGLAESYHNVAIAYRNLDQLEWADEHELRAIEFARQASNAHMVALALVGRAEVSLRRGDAALAEVTASRAARDLAAIPDPSRQADALRLCGVARSILGRTADAADALDTAVRLASTHGSALIEAECRRARAEVSGAAGRWPDALEDARKAAEIFLRLGSSAEHASTMAWIDRHSDEVG